MTKENDTKTDVSKSMAKEFGAGWADTLKTILADVVDHETTRLGTKSLAVRVVNRFTDYAESTSTKIDDYFAAKLKTEVDDHFSEWYDYFFRLIGIQPNGLYSSGQPLYGCQVAPTDIEVKAFLDKPSQFLGDVSGRFGVSAATVKTFIEMLLPFVIELFLKKSA